MSDILWSPEHNDCVVLRATKDNSAQEITIGQFMYKLHGVAFSIQATQIVREIALRRGFDLARVPVIHRINKRFRYFDIQPGATAASYFCIQLVQSEWRFATEHEVAQARIDWKHRRRAAKEAAVKAQTSAEVFGAGAAAYLQPKQSATA